MVSPGDSEMINLRIMKRRLLRGAVRDNLRIAKDIPLQRHMLPNALRLTWFSDVAMAAVVLALAPLVYFAVTMSKASHATEQTSLPTMVEPVSQLVAHGFVPGALSAPIATEFVDPVPLSPLAAPGPDNSEPGSLDERAVLDVEPEVSQPRVPDPRSLDFKAFALVVKKIVIDPGHGGDDPGAVIAHGLTEKEITLDIGLRLRALLLDSSFDVRMTREKDETRSLVKRSMFANEEEGDLFVSIHLNWVIPRQARVVETYYLGATEDRTVLQLAGAENRQSGYSTADFRRLLDGVYSDIKRGESRKLAEVIQSELARALHDTNPSSTSRAVKTAPFVVLVGANMPAILTEVACLSNKEEAQLLATPEYRQHIAQALYAGIRSYANALDQAQMKRKESPS